MIIDGHAHLGGEYKNLQTILSTLDAGGVGKVVLCPADSERHEPLPIPDVSGKLSGKELNFFVNRLIRSAGARKRDRGFIESGNREVFNVAALSDDRIIQFFWADPLKNGIIDELEEKLILWKFKGLKLHQSYHPFKMISPEFHNFAEFAASKNLPVFIHIHSKKEVLEFISVSANYKTTFIIGHLIGLEIFIQQKKRVSNNICFDISCPPLVATDRIKLALKEFGPERIIMGSDTPYGRNNLAEIISKVMTLNLRSGESEMILGNNMKDILGI